MADRILLRPALYNLPYIIIVIIIINVIGFGLDDVSAFEDPLMSKCGKIGVPHLAKSVDKMKYNSYRYLCNDNHVLDGSMERTCIGTKFTGSVPACVPILQMGDFKNLFFRYSPDKLLNAPFDNSTCHDDEGRKLEINFDSIMITRMYVWLRKQTNDFILETKFDNRTTVFHPSIHYPDIIAHLYVFEIRKVIERIYLQITDPTAAVTNCFKRISFANPSVSIRCGKPDLPEKIGLVRIDSTKSQLHCAKGFELVGNSEINCIGLEKWDNVKVECVESKLRLWIILISALLVILFLLAACCLFRYLTSRSEIVLDKPHVLRNVMQSYSGIKVDSASISMMRVYDKIFTCNIYTAQYKGRVVCAHVCSSNSNVALESVRCLLQAVAFNFKHPNLVPLMVISNDPNDNPILIFPYFGNGHLDNFVRSQPTLAVKKLLKLNLDVAAGMAFLGCKRVVHRDLRANNCYVDDSLVVKIGNFNFSHRLEKHDVYKSKDCIEKERLPWAAPESIADNIYSTKSDVWSYGVLLWEVFSLGGKPFLHKTEIEITSYMLSGERLPKPVSCPINVYAIMNECWKLDSLDRPSFDEIIKQITALS